MDELRAGEVWEGALAIIQSQVSQANYDTWLRDSQGTSYQGNLFTISVPNTFTAEWLQTRMLTLIKKALLSITGQEPEMEIRVTGAPELKPHLLFPLNPLYTFDTFVVGQCNRLAQHTAQQAVLTPHRGYSPLFIHSGTGLGKTHLLQAVAHLAWSQGVRFRYAHAEDFTQDFVTAIERRQGQDFRRRYRTVDLLIIDDIQFLSGKARTEEGFLHTINELHNRNRQIVVSCDGPPQNVPLCAELRSRFQGGLATELEPLDRNTGMAILQHKAKQYNLTLPPDAAECILSSPIGSIRDLEGYLNQILVRVELQDHPLDLDLVKSILAPQEPSPVECIIQAVAQYLHLPQALLLSRRRHPQAVLGRQIIIYLLREELGLIMLQIANLLGLAKSTVIYSYEKIARLLPKQPDLQQALKSIVSSLQPTKVEILSR